MKSRRQNSVPLIDSGRATGREVAAAATLRDGRIQEENYNGGALNKSMAAPRCGLAGERLDWQGFNSVGPWGSMASLCARARAQSISRFRGSPIAADDLAFSRW